MKPTIKVVRPKSAKVSLKGMPERVVYTNDTPGYKTLRNVLYCLLALFFVVSTTVSILGAIIGYPSFSLMILSIILVIGIPAIDLLVRPGKHLVFLLTIPCVVVICLVPVLIFTFPMLLILWMFSSGPPETLLERRRRKALEEVST